MKLKERYNNLNLFSKLRGFFSKGTIIKILVIFIGIPILIFFSLNNRFGVTSKEIPIAVNDVLFEYVNILKSSSDIESCAEKFLKIAGGDLVNHDASYFKSGVIISSLKNDFDKIKLYEQPLKIIRVYIEFIKDVGESFLRGKVYKIWIAKINKKKYLIAPISIIVPEGHPTIKTPKVIEIGEL
jgi:hypothetical protein